MPSLVTIVGVRVSTTIRAKEIRSSVPAGCAVLGAAILTLGVYLLVPGELSLDPVEMGNTKLLVLGIGNSACDIAVEASRVAERTGIARKALYDAAVRLQ